VNDLRERLSHVLWIGGGPCVGKTMLSRLIAGKYDLEIYYADWHHVREQRGRPGGVPAGWDALSMDERWLQPSPVALAEREIRSWTAHFALVVEDLLAMPSARPILAEGPSLFPWSVASVIASPRQAIFLLPTPDFRASVLDRRGGGSATKTTDPERASRNIAERDAILASRIAATCQQLGLRHVRVDGSLPIDESAALLEEHFAPHLPADYNV